jgi:hypothetical protein
MTEVEWLVCCDPDAMLQFLRGKASDRKLRLIGVYCCSGVGDLFDAWCLRSLRAAEEFAEGLIGPQELELAWDAANEAFNEFDNREGREEAALAARSVCESKDIIDWISPLTWKEAEASAALIREMFGNPFSPAAGIMAFLSWNDGTVPKLAQTIYDGRAFDRLPLLADALEDAGCDDADILSHCRTPGEHVRGCWVVDLLLGKS